MKLYILAICFISGIAHAGDIKYPAMLIPAAMKENANVVKRLEIRSLEIKNTGETYLYEKYAYTILNEAGESAATFYQFYDKFQHIIDVEGTLYDKFGNYVKRIRNKDIQDFSAWGDAMQMDSRVKTFSFYTKDFPYTVEFESKIRVNQTFRFDSWMPQTNNTVSVESSILSVTMPQDYDIRVKAFNYPGKPVETREKNTKTYTWQVSQLPARKWDYASPRWKEVTTSVYIAPTTFEVADYKGSMNSWSDLGKFIYELDKGRDQLPDAVVQKVQSLTKDLTTTQDKIRVLYKYLQDNTRYISIQLGIGGYQTMEASQVAKTGYGDCKALSNYMYSLLKAAGIPSYYALVKAGMSEQFLMEDFPSNQFNHQILCVPQGKDTTWLECTDQTAAPGYMGTFTGNRKALLITENGGVLVATPRYTLRENTLERNINATLDAEGNLNMQISTNYGGTQQEELSGLVKQVSKDKVQKYLQESFDLSTYEVKDFSYNETSGAMPVLDEKLTIGVKHYATVTGKRLFMAPNLLNRLNARMDDDTARKTDIVFTSEYTDNDVYDIVLPEGYEPESLPKDVTLQTQFGTYKCQLKLEGNKLHYQRTLQRVSGRFPAKDYPALVKFLNEVSKSDRSKMVLVKKSA